MARPSGKNERSPYSRTSKVSKDYNPYQRPLFPPQSENGQAEHVLPRTNIIEVLIHKGTDHVSLAHHNGQLYLRSLDAGKMLGWALGKIKVILPTEQIENLKKGYLGRLRNEVADKTDIIVGSDDSFVPLEEAWNLLQAYIASDRRVQESILPRASSEKSWSISEFRQRLTAQLTGLFAYMRNAAAKDVQFRLRQETSQPRPRGNNSLR